MRPKSILISPIAADRNGVSAAETMAGAGNMTIGGALASGGVATFSQPCHVTVYAGGNESGRTLIVTGTDRYGQVLTETITGPNATTVNGERNFKTVTQVAVDAATAGDVEIGNQDALESQWIPVDKYGSDMSISGIISSGANFTWAVQHTLTNVQSAGFQEHSANAIVHATLTGETTSQNGSYSTPVIAVRFAITSFVSGTLTGEVVQAGS